MPHSGRSLLSAMAVALPIGLGTRVEASMTPVVKVPMLRFRPFEEAVREAFGDRDSMSNMTGQTYPCRRVEIGHSEQVRAGVQGCYNDRPFAGFPAGHLRLVRTGSEPGPIWQGIRLYISTVDIALTGGLTSQGPSRPLDFASLPPAPTFS